MLDMKAYEKRQFRGKDRSGAKEITSFFPLKYSSFLPLFVSGRVQCKTQLQVSARGGPVIWPLSCAGSPSPAVEESSPADTEGSASKELGLLWQQSWPMAYQNPV